MYSELMAVTVIIIIIIIIINKSTMWTKCEVFTLKPAVYIPTKRL